MMDDQHQQRGKPASIRQATEAALTRAEDAGVGRLRGGIPSRSPSLPQGSARDAILAWRSPMSWCCSRW